MVMCSLVDPQPTVYTPLCARSVRRELYTLNIGETGKDHIMSTLIAVGYDNPFKAEEIRMKLQKMQAAYLIDLDDAVVAVKNAKGKVKLHQAHNMTAF